MRDCSDSGVRALIAPPVSAAPGSFGNLSDPYRLSTGESILTPALPDQVSITHFDKARRSIQVSPVACSDRPCSLFGSRKAIFFDYIPT